MSQGPEGLLFTKGDSVKDNRLLVGLTLSRNPKGQGRPKGKDK